MIEELFTNNAVSLLAAPLGITDTTLTVLPGNGDLFPTIVSPTQYFLITLEDQASTIREICRVTARSGDVFTLGERGLEDTVQRAWPASLGNDTLVDHRLTAGTLMTLRNVYDNPSFPSLTTFNTAIDFLLANGGSAPSGSLAFNRPFLLSVPSAGTTTLTVAQAFLPGSTALYVGGLRQKLGTDYIESGLTLQLQFEITQADIDRGQSITLDFIAA